MLTQVRLKELLDYNPETGVFVWKVKPARRIMIGDVAGSFREGRVFIRINKRTHRASRLAWLYMTGKWPVGEVDHKDTVSSNNAWLNLRDVSRQINQQNTCRAMSTNVCGFLGVSQKPWGYMARIYAGGKQHYLGTFRSAESAHVVYVEAKRKLHGGNTL